MPLLLVFAALLLNSGVAPARSPEGRRPVATCLYPDGPAAEFVTVDLI